MSKQCDFFYLSLHLYYRPVNKEELFNLCHAVACNVVEHIFGIVKRRWVILTHPAEYSMTIQVHIPPALAALHNFILEFDPADIDDFLDDPIIFDETAGGELPDISQFGGLTDGPPTSNEKAEAEKKRDNIAEAMWTQYQQWLINEGLL